MLCTYFSKHRAAFQPAVSVQELVTKLSSSDKTENSTLISVIKHFREKMWERVSTETDMPPYSADNCICWLSNPFYKNIL
jgi:hypothetical protein